ncbi:hypothetical protein B0T10DRAFT_490367 [Thelonectria olida]|uniref:Uncharacterized protein n=1 Tax=Thelonectria olida TaxID=1576542 RepID=A0A9P8W0B4_9HYPO|nr:hypothetical protein B0T10DRAFT_490367 [Thelonectria olida]
MSQSNARTQTAQHDAVSSNPVLPGPLDFLDDLSVTGGANDIGLQDHSLPWDANIWDGALISFNEGPNSRSTANTGYSERTRRRRRHHLQSSQRTRQSVQLVSNIPPTLSTHEIWPRGRDFETWHFCARELISFVGSFATTASSPFIVQPSGQFSASSHLGLHSSLQKALGVCAAYCTLDKAHRHVFQRMLETEIQLLVESSKTGDTQPNCPSSSGIHGHGLNQVLVAFRQDLARLQTMTLYQIIGMFSTDAGRRRLAKEREALLASWTRELLLRIQVLAPQSNVIPSFCSNSSTFPDLSTNDPDDAHDQHSIIDDSHLDSTSLSWYEAPLQQEEMVSAYRTILASYLVRSVYSVLSYQTCALLGELGSLPIYMPQKQPHRDLSTVSPQGPWSEMRQNAEIRGLMNTENQTISYNDFADLWSEQSWNAGLEGFDRFTILLLVACKGVEITKC